MLLGGLDIRAQQLAVVRPALPVPSDQTGSGAITGVVVDATSGQPVAGAVVTLEERPLGSRPRSRAQVTTPKGRFAFVDLPASDSYFLTAAKSGYLDGGYGRADPRGPATPLSLGKDQWLRDIRATLSKPGSISGTVVDERGEPIVGVLVRLLPQILMSGRAQWLAGPVARTDDRGAYRIAGLGPGRYVVSVPSVQSALPATASVRPPSAMAGGAMADLVAMRDASRQERLIVDVGGGQQAVVGSFAVPPPGPDGARTAYPMTFHPNVVSAASATTIDLTASEDRLAVDIQLRPVRALRVSGVVQGPREAVGNRLLRLMSTGTEDLGQGSETAITMTMADGRFTFLDVPSGSYVLDSRPTLMELSHTSMAGVQTVVPLPVAFPARHATSASIKAAPPGVKLSSLYDGTDGSFWGQVRVEVSDRDVDDVALTLRPPVTMTGRIVWAPGSAPSALSLVLALEPADGRRSLGLLTPRGGPGTESFAFDGLMAGEYFLRVLIGNATIESISWEGRDYADRPFDASAGRDLQGVVVTLTSAVSSISGTVSDGSGAMNSGAAVIAFPVNPERWSNYGFNPPRLTSVLSTADGRFRLDGLPVGDYYLLAVPAALERAWLDPSFLASRAARAARVRIERSDAKISNLTLSLVK